MRSLLLLCSLVHPSDVFFRSCRWEIRKMLVGQEAIQLLVAIEKICKILHTTFRETYKGYRPGDVNLFEQVHYIRQGLMFITIEYYTPNKFNVACEAERRYLKILEVRLAVCLAKLKYIAKSIILNREKVAHDPAEAPLPHAMRTAILDYNRSPPQKFLIREHNSSVPLPECMHSIFQAHETADEFFSAQGGHVCNFCLDSDFLKREDYNFVFVCHCPHLYCPRCFRFLKRSLDLRCTVASCRMPFVHYSDRRSFETFKALSRATPGTVVINSLNSVPLERSPSTA
ncbi:uncharacterized protein LOC108675974 isoform X2 [Hyalella azteca]|nr:uncharacterized protein LOC108675974 isoform X2 [Hyalella azteca]XP_047737672.1 uncharacterized protein LOC108675974 isoform X2 [Hyalella azteca]